MHIFIRDISHHPLSNVQRFMIESDEANTSCFIELGERKCIQKEPIHFGGSLLCQSSKLLSDKM